MIHLILVLISIGNPTDRKEFDKDDTNGDGKLDYVEFRRAIMEDVDNLAEFKYSYLLKWDIILSIIYRKKLLRFAMYAGLVKHT